MRTSWVLLLAALALCAMLLTACGTSGDDRAKVEASLRQYLTNLHPQACLGSRLCGQGVFPIGAGFPQVRENSCKKTHIGAGGRLGWTCVVTFAHGKVAQPVAVAVKGSDEVYDAVPVSRQKLTPARVYQGGP